MPTYQMQAPDGKMYRIDGPAGASDDQVRAEIIKQNPHLGGGPAEPPAAPSPGATPAPAPGLLASGGRGIIDPLTVAGKGLAVLRAPLKAAFDLAGQADVAAGIKTPEQAARRAETYSNIPIPMAVGALTGGASLPAQAIMQMGTTAAMQEGGLEPKSAGQVALSGAAPFLGELAARGVRALGRTATRVVPDLFRKAQAGAQTELGQVQAGLGAAADPTELFRTARATGNVKIPASNLQSMVDDLELGLFEKPVGAEAKMVKELVTKGKEIAAGGEVSLGDLLKFRKELQPVIGKAPDIRALYKATMADLESGSSVGSRMAVEAIDMARKNHGRALFGDLVEKATEVRAIGGADLPSLNVAKLAKLVQADQKDLVKALGPDGFAQIEQFISRNRSLPPTHAWTAANKLVTGVAGGGLGIATGSLPMALGGAALSELLTNLFAVGQTPGATLAASRVIPALAGARAGAAAGQPTR